MQNRQVPSRHPALVATQKWTSCQNGKEAQNVVMKFAHVR